ncbi:nucleotidyltransferase family protein [Pseudochrobactrum sp. HB0163]|uniref:nucleotidyltransferase family protein n=1 Tax=Pseudochrobactrum sp. HB0163 TaxID=3450708 RepID=UPI003F6DDB49
MPDEKNKIEFSPDTAMILAGGLGTRMRPLTLTMPKPLIRVAGRSLIDRGLDALVEAGVTKAVVNVHYLADQMEEHLKTRHDIKITISDEREQLLDSAGGIIKALPQLGDKVFYILNADTFWVDQQKSNLRRLAGNWDEKNMDILLMLAERHHATGYEGRGDFHPDKEGRLRRVLTGEHSDYIYAGAALINPQIFAGKEISICSLNSYFDAAIAAGRLYGMVMQGHWITVGTPQAVGEAEAALLMLA